MPFNNDRYNGIPRECGGEPWAEAIETATTQYSPRMRG